MEAVVARRMWQLLEPYHAVVYFVPETVEGYKQAGLKGYWMGYFASRAAAMGPVPAEVVMATFYNFHPRMVRRAIPDAWSFSSPAKVLDARHRGVDAALRRLLGDAIDSDVVAEAASLARRVADACDASGHPLYAGHASLPWPAEPHLALWHAATLLREHRGDGHVAVLVAEGIDGCEAHVMLVASGRSTAEIQREFRRWSEDEWAEAVARLRARGLVDASGSFTDAGRDLHVAIERRTDELALVPYRALDEGELDRLNKCLETIIPTIVGQSIPYPNPMGLPAPGAAAR
ncbi:MAG TPA: hypothetical protein VIG64_09850 [Actinomycetota bacterium]|jgi:hypothetical protein